MKNSNRPFNIFDLIAENSSKFEVLDSGGEADVYLFKLINQLRLDSLLPSFKTVKVLYYGTYVLKEYVPWIKLSNGKINKLLDLSNLGLIPKIYLISDKYIIMDYIKGKTLKQIMKEYGRDSPIVRKLQKRILELEDIWFKKLKIKYVAFDRGNYGNFIVTDEKADNPKIYVIDPIIYA